MERTICSKGYQQKKMICLISISFYEMVKLLVFDTETTGLDPLFDLKKKGELTYLQHNYNNQVLTNNDANISFDYWNYWISKWPHIVQLSFILLDTENSKNTKMMDFIIDLPEDIPIPFSSSSFHKIYKNKKDAILDNKENDSSIQIISELKKKKKYKKKIVSIHVAMTQFMNEVKKCDYIIAHNFDFDIKMIYCELKRLEQKDDMEYLFKLNEEQKKCTLKETRKICNIVVINASGHKYIKYPTLFESYHTFFHEPSDDIDKTKLHNSLIDCVLCLRVYCKLFHNIDIKKSYHPKLDKLFREISQKNISIPYQHPLPIRQSLRLLNKKSSLSLQK
jgi:DNA polymerase III epsilon subunit-like protein